jgi:hypothetical protein
MLIEKKFSYIKYYEVEWNGFDYGISLYFNAYGVGTHIQIESLDDPGEPISSEHYRDIMDEIPKAWYIMDFEPNRKKYLKRAGYSEI